MRTPILPPIMLLVLAAALYMLPDGALYSWRLWVRGSLARLQHPAEDETDAPPPSDSLDRDLMELLTQKNAEIADLHRRLRELGVTRDAVPKSKLIPARLIQLGPNNDLDAFTIDAGSRDGVAVGHAVVVGQSLVGVVVKSEADASLALSLSSPGCYISARLGEADGNPARPRLLAAVRGAGGGRVKAIVFSSSTPARAGWVAMTSGLEKSVPEGLLLGTVTGDFEDGAENGTLEADLRTAADLSSLDYVVVVAKE